MYGDRPFIALVFLMVLVNSVTLALFQPFQKGDNVPERNYIIVRDAHTNKQTNKQKIDNTEELHHSKGIIPPGQGRTQDLTKGGAHAHTHAQI